MRTRLTGDYWLGWGITFLAAYRLGTNTDRQWLPWSEGFTLLSTVISAPHEPLTLSLPVPVNETNGQSGLALVVQETITDDARTESRQHTTLLELEGLHLSSQGTRDFVEVPVLRAIRLNEQPNVLSSDLLERTE